MDKPNRLEDIIALVALYRPGPMSNIPIYNDCKHGLKEPDYLHPKLEEILKPTYGVIIYQEQVMQIAQALSGFTAGEADILRRAMGKKKRAELEKQKQRFVEGAFKNGISKDIAAGIFLKIEPFAEYGFNKSHAAAYAVIAYQTAYLKTYYPHEFFAASMSMELSNQKKLSEFYEELKRLNIEIVRPDINKCFSDFTSNGKQFFYALGAIKNVGYEAISNIVKERETNGEYKNLSDFIKRVDPKDINKLQLEGLVRAGAFDNLNDNRQSIYNSIPNIIIKSKNNFENKKFNQFDLYDDKLSNEENILYDQYNIVSYDNFQNDENLLSSNIACTVLKTQEKKTQKGTSYAIIKFSDLNSVFELFVFSDIFEINREVLTEGNSLMLTLMKNYIDENKTQKKINVKKIITLKEVINKPIDLLKLKFNDLSELQKIKYLKKDEGKTSIKFELQNKQNKLVFDLKDKRKIDLKQLNSLKIKENLILD